MNAAEGFVLGLAFAAAVGSLVASLAHKIATRVQATREQQRRDQDVRLAFARLAANMRRVDELARAKHDMGWPDRLKEAQVGQVVNLGISVRKAVAHG